MSKNSLVICTTFSLIPAHHPPPGWWWTLGCWGRRRTLFLKGNMGIKNVRRKIHFNIGFLQGKFFASKEDHFLPGSTPGVSSTTTDTTHLGHWRSHRGPAKSTSTSCTSSSSLLLREAVLQAPSQVGAGWLARGQQGGGHDDVCQQGQGQGRGRGHLGGLRALVGEAVSGSTDSVLLFHPPVIIAN